MKIEEKLWHIQQNLKAPKGQYNKFGDFHYRSCEDIQEAVKPLLKEVKAILLIGDEIVQIGDRFYIKATAALQDIEMSAFKKMGTVPPPAPEREPEFVEAYDQEELPFR